MAIPSIPPSGTAFQKFSDTILGSIIDTPTYNNYKNKVIKSLESSINFNIAVIAKAIFAYAESYDPDISLLDLNVKLITGITNYLFKELQTAKKAKELGECIGTMSPLTEETELTEGEVLSTFQTLGQLNQEVPIEFDALLESSKTRIEEIAKEIESTPEDSVEEIEATPIYAEKDQQYINDANLIIRNLTKELNRENAALEKLEKTEKEIRKELNRLYNKLKNAKKPTETKRKITIQKQLLVDVCNKKTPVEAYIAMIKTDIQKLKISIFRVPKLFLS